MQYRGFGQLKQKRGLPKWTHTITDDEITRENIMMKIKEQTSSTSL